jgi:hypothetical protein
MKPRLQRYDAPSVSKAILVFSRYLNGIGLTLFAFFLLWRVLRYHFAPSAIALHKCYAFQFRAEGKSGVK